MLSTSSRHDRSSRAAIQFVARLVLGLALTVGLLLALCAVLNPGAAILAAWVALLLEVCAVDGARHRRRADGDRRERLRESARRSSSTWSWPS